MKESHYRLTDELTGFPADLLSLRYCAQITFDDYRQQQAPDEYFRYQSMMP